MKQHSKGKDFFGHSPPGDAPEGSLQEGLSERVGFDGTTERALGLDRKGRGQKPAPPSEKSIASDRGTFKIRC